MRAEGRPFLSTVANVMAFGSDKPEARAWSNHLLNWAMGSASRSSRLRPAREYSFRKLAMVDGFVTAASYPKQPRNASQISYPPVKNARWREKVQISVFMLSAAAFNSE